MSAIRRTLLLAAALLATASMAAQEHPNMSKGFQPDKVYQFSNIDDIDLFTGGLKLRIPIGPEYPVNGDLKYGLTLTYNSEIWEFDAGAELFSELPEIWTSWVDAFPTPRSNAGFGWMVSLGKVFEPSSPGNDGLWWIYEGPDGAEHPIGDDDGDLTSDGTYIRLRKTSSTLLTLEFPDGDQHTFQRFSVVTQSGSNDNEWRITGIKDRYNNQVTISYPSNTEWRITDSHGREQKIFFQATNYTESAYHGRMIDRIELTGFNGAPMEYDFQYEDGLVKTSCEQMNSMFASGTYTVPTLKKLVLPDGSFYEMTYATGLSPANCEQGAITNLRLTTGGSLAWSYVKYKLPLSPCRAAYFQTAQDVPGVGVRALVDSGGVERARWEYKPELSTPLTRGSCTNSNGSKFTSKSGYQPYEYTKTTVKMPDGTYTTHYFSGWPETSNSTNGYMARERGLPFRRMPDGTFLSTEFKTCETCSPLRSTYVKYEYEYGGNPFYASNKRLKEEKTVYHDDGNHWTQTLKDSYDGLGHYRSRIESSNFEGASGKVFFTNFNPNAGTLNVEPDGDILQNSTLPLISAPWILNTYDWDSVTQTGDTVRTSRYCFDSSTGLLLRKRVLADGMVNGPRDLLAVYAQTLPSPFSAAQNGKGNVLREEYFGGDDQTIGTGTSLCTLTLPAAPKYTVYHEYQFGMRNLTKYKDAAFKTLDLTIDEKTGLMKQSRDTAGILTEYTYDSMLRVFETKPAARATAKIVHDTTAQPPSVTIQALHPATSAILTDERFYYDQFGRVIQTREQMDGGWSTTNKTYDSLGRLKTVSAPVYRAGSGYEVFTPSAFTTYDYTIYDDIASILNPDGSATSHVYTGDRIKETTHHVATALGQSDTPVVKTEKYDHHGRVISVIEKSGPTTANTPTGTDVTTDYTYNAADQLMGVKMTTSGGAVQTRTFDYDGRRFLRWESHPESGMTSFTYDARGHVVSARQGAADSPFDLNYQYDSAERLTLTSGRNPLSPSQFRPLKEYEYGVANASTAQGMDWRLGKIVRGTRYNYSESQWDPAFKVDNVYDYVDAAGRLHGRKQKISKVYDDGWEEVMKELAMSQTLNELDLLQTMDYPMCVGCGGPPVTPTRSLQHNYQFGRLTRIDGVVGTSTNPITYWPNGMRQKLPHSNGITDRQEVGDMPRPTEISFRTYDRCVSPSFITQPAGGTGARNLSVSVSGTGPFQFEWWSYNDTTSSSAGTTQAISVNPAVKTHYYVTVANPCGVETSQTAIVVPSGCELPSTGGIVPVLQPDGSWILRPDPIARSPRTYQWRRVSDNALLGSSETLAIGALPVTTTYSFTITDTCGSATSNVTIQVPLSITKTAFAATWIPATGIRLTWPAVTGATNYDIERRSGTTWEYLASTSSTAFDDTAIQTGRSYAYRIRGTGNGSVSGYSNSDVATTVEYPPVVIGTAVTAQSFAGMLDAVNKIRGAAGLPAVTWNSILSPLDPLPDPGVRIIPRHIMTCRARMTEALQAVGAIPKLYTDPDPILKMIKAIHINEVQDQAK